MKNIIKNFSYSAFANGVNLVVTAFSALIVPKILGVREYSYWQLYIFYTSYVGFFHFGWADGIYLKQGGKKYSELDKDNMATQFRLYVLFEFFIMAVIVVVSMLLIKDSDRGSVLVFTGLCLFITLPRTFLQYLLQATDRISEYASNIIFEKIIYVIAVIILLLFGIKEYYPLLIVDLFAKIVTLFLLGNLCRDIIFYKVQDFGAAIREAWDNISVGIKLMFANIAGLLLNGIVKLFIEHHWGVETFGKTSLTMSISNMLMVFISAVSVVLYPMLRNISQERMAPLYKRMREILLQFTLGFLLFYYPVRKILSAWLPQYADSLKYMALLFPICVFESKTNMLTNTYFKALRMEKVMMIINWISVVFTFVFAYISVEILDNLTMTMMGLMLAMGVKSTLAEIYLNIKMELGIEWNIAAEWLLVFLFGFLAWNINGWFCMAGYLIGYLVYTIFNLKQVVALMKGKQ